jgi:Tol biopolymer transport system component
MKSHRALIAFIVLSLAALACSLPLGSAAVPSPTATQPVVQIVPTTAILQVPTAAAPAPTAVSNEPTAAAVPTVPVTLAAPTTAPTAVVPPVQPASAPGALVLAKISTPPGQTSDLRLVDPVTGLTQSTFQVSGLPMGPYPLVGGKSIFFTDNSSSGVHRAGFDGQTQDLTFMNPDQKIFDGLFLPSPDGSRIAWSKVLSEDASGTHTQLWIANVDGTGQKALIDETRQLPSRPEPVRWSNDGKALYYTNVPYGIGGYILFFGGSDLAKVDIASGQSTPILITGCLCDAVLSPDESQVAYVQKPEADQMTIFLRKAAGGDPQKASLPANHLQAGGIVWSPDGQSFLVTSARGEPDNEAFSVVLFHAADMSSKVLVPDDARLLQAAVWPAAGVVWLNDKDGNAWRLDPASGTLTQSSNGERALIGSH